MQSFIDKMESSSGVRVNRHFCTVFVIRQLMIQLNYVHSELTFICAKFVR